MSYAKGTNPLQDGAGNEVASFTGQAVSNETPDPAPTVSSASVNGSTLTLTFDEALAPASDTPEATELRYAFAVKGILHGVDQHPQRVAVSDSTVTLTLGAAAAGGQEVTVSYEAGKTGDKLRDANGNEVASFTDQPVTNDTPGGAAGPVLERAQVFAGGEGQTSTLELTFGGALEATPVPAAATFSVWAIAPDDSGRIIGGKGTVGIAGAVVTVELDGDVFEDDLASASYEKGTDANPLQDSGGNVVADIENAQADVIDRQPPALVSGSVGGSDAVLYFSEALDAGSAPAVGDFTVSVAGSGRNVSAVGIAGSAVTLTLASAAAAGQTVAVSYTAGTSPIRDTAGNDAASFSGQELTNEGPGDPGQPALVATDPAVADGSELRLTYEQPLDPSSVPGREAFELFYTVLPARRRAATRPTPPASSLSRAHRWCCAWIRRCGRATTTSRRATPGRTRIRSRASTARRRRTGSRGNR